MVKGRLSEGVGRLELHALHDGPAGRRPMIATAHQWRSLLIVSPAEIERANASHADALVIRPDRSALPDLSKRETRPPARMIGIEVDRAQDMETVGAAMDAGPDFIVLAGCRSPADVEQLGARLAVLEATLDREDGETGIVASVADTAEALQSLCAGSRFAPASRRLLALTWNAPRLSASLGSTESFAGPDIAVSPLALARTMTLLAARAAGLPALDTPEDNHRLSFIEHCRTVRRLGYSGKTTSVLAEVDTINTAFGRE